MSSPSLPILDYSALLAGGTRKAAFLRELAEAARTVGFFYLRGHGLCEKQREVLTQAQHFLALSPIEKERVHMRYSPHFRGYTEVLGELTQGQPDRREQFDIMDESLAVSPHAGDAPWLKLYGPNQWPSMLPLFKPTVLGYQQALTALTTDLIRAFAESLKQPANSFDATLEQPYTHMKLIRYPGATPQQDASRQGVGAHKDPGYITIVTQDEQSGLEVLRDGQGWVAVPPLEGAVVVNIGELLELASDGYLRATLHRVVSPPAGVERYSCAFFIAPQLDSTVPVLDLPEALKAQALGPSSDPDNPLLHQVGENVLKGRLRSHPEVAKRYYHSAA
ncbi:MAG: isopenicillin N synthase family oxygenase [Idiomarina sp.]|nr:isopenicillin N synthase family oxygenase [Idiomarina sp.]